MRVETPSVLLIYTGGTIGMIENPETGALENFNFDHLLKHVPELKRFNYRISSYQFNPPIDSSDMEPAYWAILVKIINYNYDYFDGFVILHGTDTMAYTASALSFMLENLSKPVILLGYGTSLQGKTYKDQKLKLRQLRWFCHFAWNGYNGLYGFCPKFYARKSE